MPQGSDRWGRALCALAFVVSACADNSRSDNKTVPPVGDVVAASTDAGTQHELSPLHELERKAHASIDVRTQPLFASGPDPYRIMRLPPYPAPRKGEIRDSISLTAYIMRGADKLVVGSGISTTEYDAPRGPTGLAAIDRYILAVGEYDRRIWVYDRGGLGTVVKLDIPGLDSPRDIALYGDHAFILDGFDGQLFTAKLDRPRKAQPRLTNVRVLDSCRGPIALETGPELLMQNCLLEHRIKLWKLKPGGEVVTTKPTLIEHVAPMWSMDATTVGNRTIIAIGGAENRNLDRSDGGSFGYIDSFAYLYALEGTAVRQLASDNLSARGVVTPKWIAITSGEGNLRVTTAGYATPTLIELVFDPLTLASKPALTTSSEFAPGTTDAVAMGSGWIATNTLLDGITTLSFGTSKHKSRTVARTIRSRIGEALFFTHLMAPWNRTEGKKSRFTCETCHFEGMIDGRVHYTGRGTVHAATKPLRGLFNNRPHFSRALDRSMAQMVHNEFRVSNLKSGHGPWFDLDRAKFAWLAEIPGVPDKLTATELRLSLMQFLIEYNHRPNPSLVGRTELSALQRRGAAAFRDLCEGCHSARLVADAPTKVVPFDDWEALILSPQSPIVWARADYYKTGVEPYVHDSGARVPSLRRLYAKWPYFTNGRAKSIEDVLEFARVGDEVETFLHVGERGRTLTGKEKQALAAFLRAL